MIVCLCVLAIIALVTIAYSLGHRDGEREEHERHLNAIARDSVLPTEEDVYEALYSGSFVHNRKRTR